MEITEDSLQAILKACGLSVVDRGRMLNDLATLKALLVDAILAPGLPKENRDDLQELIRPLDEIQGRVEGARP